MVNKSMNVINDENSADQELSKSAVKQQMHELKVLGEKIVALPDAQLNLIPLEEKLLDAVLLARKITKRGGLKRQLQYIGKLMRNIDPEPIKAVLDNIENAHLQDNKAFHLKEQWRDELLSGGNDKLTEFYDVYPGTDLQRLRQLIRSYKNAGNDDKKKQAARLVFQLISEQAS